MTLLIVYTACLALFSTVAFVLYAVDKRRAQRGQWRISEATLLAFSVLLGAVGATAAMHLCRHKTKHRVFRVVNAICVVWQMALFAYLVVKYA